MNCPILNSFHVEEFFIPQNDSLKQITMDIRDLDGSSIDTYYWSFEFNNDTNSLCIYGIREKPVFIYDSMWFKKNDLKIHNFRMYFLGDGAKYICKNNTSNHFIINVPNVDNWDMGFPSSAERWYVLNNNTIIPIFKERKRRFRNWQLRLQFLKRIKPIKLIKEK